MPANTASPAVDDFMTTQSLETNRPDNTEKAQQVVALVLDGSILFHDQSGECYATYRQGNHLETWPITSKGFSDWLSYKAHHSLGFVPADASMKTALTALRGIATHEGETHPVYLRCAPWRNGYIIDLCNEAWQVISVTPEGWDVLNESPIKFIRSRTAKPLPLPKPENLELLWKYVNVLDADKTLLLAYMLDSLRSNTPYPVLSFIGGQGTGKSFTHKVIRQLCDPNTVPLRAAPKSVEDVFVSAGANHMASFENMSSLSSGMQDALCTLSTGGGFAKRKLYSDSDETVIEVKRPVIINGISDSVTRPDLIDRMIRIDTPRLGTIADEIEMHEGYERDRPAIFGALLNLFVDALRLLPEIQLTSTPRMIGYAKLGEAIHKALGINHLFIDDYQRNRTESMARSLDASPAAMAVQEMMCNRKEWEGTVKALKSALEEYHRQDSEGWPRSIKGMGDVLRRMAPALRGVGINIEFLGRQRDGWHVRISSCDEKNGDRSNVHNVHTCTPREHVNVVNVDPNVESPLRYRV